MVRLFSTTSCSIIIAFLLLIFINYKLINYREFPANINLQSIMKVPYDYVVLPIEKKTSLLEEDIEKIFNLVEKAVFLYNESAPDFRKIKPLDQYIFQVLVDSQLEVKNIIIQAAPPEIKSQFTEWETVRYSVRDGESSYFVVVIDLVAEEVIGLFVNGES